MNKRARIPGATPVRPEINNVDSPLADGLRLVWGLGPMALYFLAAHMISTGTSAVSTGSLIYFAVLVACIVCRLIDIAFFAGPTITGQRATFRHWRTYSIALSAFALPLWAFVQALTGD